MKIKALNVYRHDADAEENGKWVPIADGVEFRIRRLRSKTVNKARETIYGPFERAMGPRQKELPDSVEVQCTVKLLSSAVIVDWRGEGMKDDHGNPIPFSVDTAAEILNDADTGKDLRATVIALAMDGDVFAPDSPQTEIDEKN